MTLVLANSGGYPRSGDTAELQVLERTLRGLETGEMNTADLADAENEMTRRAIEEQASAGLEVFTDGLIRWADPVSHIAEKLGGIRLDGSVPYFSTGASCRQPNIEARPQRVEPLLVDEYRFARNALGQLPTTRERAGRLVLKVVLTGPHTLARFSHANDASMKPIEARIAAFAEAIAAEIVSLAEVGADFIQVDEPAILQYPQDWTYFAAACEQLAQARQSAARGGRRPQLALHLPFGDAAPVLEQLLQVPVDILGMDFTASPRLLDAVAVDGSPIPIGLGMVNGQSETMEDPAGLARQVERVLPRVGGARAYLSPNCGLERLPRPVAFAKLQLLSRIREHVHG